MKTRLFTIIILLIMSFTYLIGTVITGKTYIHIESEPEIITVYEKCEEVEEVEEIECPRYVRIEKMDCSSYKEELKECKDYIDKKLITF